jgi:hypothetical protein
MPVLRKKLTEAEFSNPALRWNADCDCIEFSSDGGETWQPDPNNDPRTSIIYKYPPLTGSDRQCRAAAGMVDYIRQVIDQTQAPVDAVGLAGGIIGIIVFIPGFNVLWALILTIAFFIIDIGASIVFDSFTESVYDELLCIFYCNIDSSGQMDAAGYDEMYAQLITFDTIPRTVIQQLVAAVGYVGLSNAGVALEQAADCDECPCCDEESIEVYMNDGGGYTIVQGAQVGTSYVVSTASGTTRRVTVKIPLSPFCVVTDVEIEWYQQHTVNTTQISQTLALLDESDNVIQSTNFGGGTVTRPSGTPYVDNWTPTGDVQAFWAQGTMAFNTTYFGTGECRIYRIKVTYSPPS